MKKRFRSRLRAELGDAVLEIILSVIFLAIGGVVLAFFGVSGDAEWLDADIVILIGIGAVLIIGSVIGVAVWIVKKKNKEKNNANNSGENDKTKGE